MIAKWSKSYLSTPPASAAEGFLRSARRCTPRIYSQPFMTAAGPQAGCAGTDSIWVGRCALTPGLLQGTTAFPSPFANTPFRHPVPHPVFTKGCAKCTAGPLGSSKSSVPGIPQDGYRTAYPHMPGKPCRTSLSAGFIGTPTTWVAAVSPAVKCPPPMAFHSRGFQFPYFCCFAATRCSRVKVGGLVKHRGRVSLPGGGTRIRFRGAE